MVRNVVGKDLANLSFDGARDWANFEYEGGISLLRGVRWNKQAVQRVQLSEREGLQKLAQTIADRFARDPASATRYLTPPEFTQLTKQSRQVD
jgi:hypothetical protein